MEGVDDPTTPERPRGSDRDRPARPERLPERYRLGDVLGVGGMGRVYRARDTVLNRDVAIKVIDRGVPDTGGTQRRDRFVREARAAARLVHPSIVAVHDVDAEAGWLVMDLVEGEPLRDVIARAPMEPARARALAEQVLAALDTAHANGVIHRDIKPSNLMIDRAGKVTLVDFGVARLVDVELTQTGENLGTPAYMAPEQLRGGKVDARTDLYGLAATLFEVVSTERMTAFDTPSAAELARVTSRCTGEPGLAELITRCLQADPDARPPSARDALAVVNRTAPAPRTPRRGRRLAIIAGALAAAGAIAAAVIILRGRGGSDTAGDPRKAEMFALAQRGEPEKAGVLLDQYIAQHPNDTEARTMKILTDWWVTGLVRDEDRRTAGLDKDQRDMIHGIALFSARKEQAAIAFLEEADRAHPNTVMLMYALGEARWHGQMLERGVETLERAFALDPHWEMALHHVLEFHLSRGEIDQLVPIVDKLRTVDPASAAAQDCQLAIGRRDYIGATRLAIAAIEHQPPIPALYECLMQAQVLTGDLVAAEATAHRASERWAIDLRQWGGHALEEELLLYRGQFDEYLDQTAAEASTQRRLALGLWRPTPDLFEPVVQTGDDVRGPPLGAASDLMIAHELGQDRIEVYQTAPEPELRAFGKGLAADLLGDSDTAVAELRRALTVPAKGDMRMLAAYELARVLHKRGDDAGAAEACAEILTPRQYQAYRAAIMPDCVLWSGDRARWKALDQAWSGKYLHPAVIEIRRRLAADP